MSELTPVHLITFNSIWNQRHNLDGEYPLTSISAAIDESIGYTSVMLRKAANFANMLEIKANIHIRLYVSYRSAQDVAVRFIDTRVDVLEASLALIRYYRWTSASVNFLIPFSFFHFNCLDLLTSLFHRSAVWFVAVVDVRRYTTWQQHFVLRIIVFQINNNTFINHKIYGNENSTERRRRRKKTVFKIGFKY